MRPASRRDEGDPPDPAGSEEPTAFGREQALEPTEGGGVTGYADMAIWFLPSGAEERGGRGPQGGR
jgi:hypothetical protein